MPTDLITIVFLPFLVAFLVTAFLTPFTIKITKYFKLLDDPARKNHPGIIHGKPVPRGGGIPLFLGCLIAGLFFLPINPLTVSIYFAAFLALIIGVIDDKFNSEGKDVSPYLRFLINILCAVIVVAAGVSIAFITNPLGGILHFETIKLPFFGIEGSLISSIISALWIIWVMNMLNWSKGIDGQMPGIVAISAIIIGLLSLRFTSTDQNTHVDATLSFIIAGAALGFLPFNFSPAKIFPGYGATSIYLLLAVVSILSGAKLATAILVMGIPTVDALFTILRRLFAGRSPFKGDRRHLHHIMLKLGYSQRQVALFYWSISAILGTLSLTLQSTSKVFAIIMLLVIAGGVLVFLHRILKTNEQHIP